MRKKVHLLGINVLVKPIDPGEESVGAIIVPDEAKKKEVLRMGTVMQKGPGFFIPVHRDKDDMQSIIDGKDNKSLEMSFISLEIEEGDTVYYPKKATVDVRIEGVNYAIVEYLAIKMYARDI